MNVCIGERLDTPAWSGPPLGRFAPPGHGAMLPVAAMQDTLFVWKEGASAAHVRSGGQVQHYARGTRVADVMGMHEEAFIAHDVPEAPGECLLVAVHPEVREQYCPELKPGASLRNRFGLLDPLLCELACALERQCVEGEPLGALYTESLATMLVSCVLAKYAGDAAGAMPPSRSGPGGLAPAQQARICGHIRERLGENISLRELAELTGYSPAHFMRLFQQTFGQSPHQFLLDQRVERAKLLLRGDHHTLSDVALACGFSSPSHFGASFARRTGMSPGRYRSARRQRGSGSQHC